MYMHVGLIVVSVPCACLVPPEVTESIRFPGTAVIDGLHVDALL